MLTREIPFLRIGLPLCAGIVTALYISPGNLFFAISAIIISILFTVSLRFNRELTNIVYGFSLTLALFVLGLFLYTKEKQGISILPGVESVFTGTISDFPEEKANTYMITVKISDVLMNSVSEPVSGSIVLYHRKEMKVKSWLPGDRVFVRCSPVEITNRGNPYEFDYRFYMERQGIRYYAFTDSSDIKFQNTPPYRNIRHKALIIREKIIDMFRERGITGERLALVAALTLGQKNMLDPEQKQHFIKAGVMHIMAVSGLHAVILSLFIFKMLFFLKGRLNIIRVVVTLLLLWAFAFVTGLTPSVLRATIMFSFLQAGNLLRRPVNGINSVLASAFVLILIRPSVIFDAGFLLSYSAVIYIICFYRDLYLKLSFKRRIPDLIWQSASVTIIAQAGTLPLTIMLFNRFPTWFILSNIIIVPLSSAVIIIGCLVPLTYPIPFLSQLIAKILSFMTGVTEMLTERAASLPLSTIENIGLTTIECILLTITIFLLTNHILRRKSISLLLPLSSLLLLLIAGTVRDIGTRRSNEVIVYNTIGYSATGIRTGKILNLYSDTGMVGQEISRHCSVLRLRPELHTIYGKGIGIDAGNDIILISSRIDDLKNSNGSPDIIILKQKPYIDKSTGKSLFPSALILTPEVTPGIRVSEMVSVIRADTVHSVRRQGAFIRRL